MLAPLSVSVPVPSLVKVPPALTRLEAKVTDWPVRVNTDGLAGRRAETAGVIELIGGRVLERAAGENNRTGIGCRGDAEGTGDTGRFPRRADGEDAGVDRRRAVVEVLVGQQHPARAGFDQAAHGTPRSNAAPVRQRHGHGQVRRRRAGAGDGEGGLAGGGVNAEVQPGIGHILRVGDDRGEGPAGRYAATQLEGLVFSGRAGRRRVTDQSPAVERQSANPGVALGNLHDAALIDDEGQHGNGGPVAEFIASRGSRAIERKDAVAVDGDGTSGSLRITQAADGRGSRVLLIEAAPTRCRSRW